jgi:hypothetical protein
MLNTQQTLDELKVQGATPRTLARVMKAIKSDNAPGAHFYVEAQKAAARLAAPKKTELEKAEKIIVKAAKLLSDIVDGNLRDNGTDTDRLTAESIKRHGPGIIISFIQLGIDVFKVYDFYKPPAGLGATQPTTIRSNQQ